MTVVPLAEVRHQALLAAGHRVELAGTGQTVVSVTRVTIYRQLPRPNALKAVLVMVATLCEVGGIGILAWALGTVLTSGR